MKKVIAIIILVALGVGAYYAWTKIQEESQPTGPAFATTSVSSIQTIEEAIEASGYVQPEVSTDVRSEISGRIARIYVEPGETVTRGQKLVELDPTTLVSEHTEAQRLYQAELLRLEQARRNYERLKDLYAKNFAQESEFLDAETAYELAKIQVEVRRAQLEKAEDNLSKTVILAPQSGVVADLNINEGQVIIGATSVNQGTLLMVIHDLSDLYVKLAVNELDIEKLSPGIEAEITFDAIPNKTFIGKISAIHPFAVNENNLRVFTVEITFDPGETRVRPGISANVRIVTQRAVDVVAVGLSAVFNEHGKHYVYVVDENGNREKRPVKTGINNNMWIEIKEGIEAGETVSLVRARGQRGQGAQGGQSGQRSGGQQQGRSRSS